MGRDRLVIVQHHRVGWPPPSARYKRMFTTPALLAFQVRLLGLAGYRFLTLGDAMAAPGKRAVVTFDDGYRDNKDYAYPILKKEGVPFAIYVPTAFPDRMGKLWWVALEAVIARNTSIGLVMDGKDCRFGCATPG